MKVNGEFSHGQKIQESAFFNKRYVPSRAVGQRTPRAQLGETYAIAQDNSSAVILSDSEIIK